ncbi:MAG: hypothetical protein JNL58_10395 [Planctomyces sp.]|nr:hypothetical protein [Planctomyces sp.]
MPDESRPSENPYRPPLVPPEDVSEREFASSHPDSEVIRLAEFRHSVTAEFAWNFLKQHGVDVHIVGTDVSTTLNYYGTAVQLIELYVRKAELEKATRLLVQFQNDLHRNKAELRSVEWACNHCNEINAGSFEICWNCGAERTLLNHEEFSIVSDSETQATPPSAAVIDFSGRPLTDDRVRIPLRIRWIIPISILLITFLLLSLVLF